MKNVKKSLALILALTMAVTLIPTHTIAQNKVIADSKAGNTQTSNATQTFKSAVINTPPLALGNEDILINSPSGITYDTKVSYEIITNGKAGITDGETSSAVVRFTLNNPSVQPVSFSYKAISGSADVYYHLTGTTTGIVSLTAEKPQQDVTIEMAAFVDKTIVDMPLPNPPNAFWSGERIFYLYCYDIKNALFDEDRESLTLPILVESEFDYEAAYENAVKSELIDLEQVPDGEDGVYQVPEPVDGIRELRMTGEISGDIRKMIDTGVFTHINLPQGYFINQSDQDQVITYKIKVANNGNGIEVIPVEQGIFINADSQTSFYSEDFTQVRTIEQINLGAEEANTLFNKIDFVFDYSDVTTPDAISTRFFDENDQYLQHQVSFSDNARPKVSSLSIDVENARYGDDIPVTIHFSEPVYTDDISFKVGEQTFHPMESTGTISEAVSFLYRIGDEALDATGFTIDVTEIAGAVDLSGNAQEIPGSGMASVDIFSSLRHAFSYCAEPTIDLDQGTSRNMLATVSINLKPDTELSNWLSSGAGSDNITTSVKAKAITNEGAIDISLTILTDATRVTGLTGSFTVPENNTGDDVYYLLEIYMDIGGGFEPVYSLATVYKVQPLILVEEESDLTINYTYWPAGDKIFVNVGSNLSLSYNVNATWQDTEYFTWSTSKESIATIDQNGVITLHGAGEVVFTLEVTNPITDDCVSIKSRTLTILKSQESYLYVPNGIKNQDLLIGSDAKISFSSNLVERNELCGEAGTKTPFTFTLYEAEYDGLVIKKGNTVSVENLDATVEAPISNYTVPAQKLTKITERNKYGYILEISAKDINSDSIMTAEANIRIRQLPAKASLIRPESVFLTDNSTSFAVEFDIDNKDSETEYLLSVTRNSEVKPVKTAASPI